MYDNVSLADLKIVNESFTFKTVRKLNLFKRKDYLTGLFLIILKHLSTYIPKHHLE